MATTRKQIEAQVECMNRKLGLPLTSSTEVRPGEYEVNVGNIHTYEQCGGMGLQQYTRGGGCRTLCYTTTKSKLYEFCLAYIKGIEDALCSQ